MFYGRILWYNTRMSAENTVPATPWYARETDDVLRILKATPGGLTSEEAQKRLEHYGANELPKQPAPTIVALFWRQFRSPLIFILVGAAVLSLAAGEHIDAFFIAVVLILNAVIGCIQEWRAERNARALQQLLTIQAIVLRDGEVQELPADTVVPGDIIILEAGNRVPADVRLLSSYNVGIDESLLTGESTAVAKNAELMIGEDTPLAERTTMAFAGSVVIRGRAKGIIVETGSATIVGQLARSIAESDGGMPPLMYRLKRFSQIVGIVIVGVATFTGIVGILWRGYGIEEMVLSSVALMVAAIPEGLPIALTVALAIAASRMGKRGVIVRRLTAVEGLGSCTLIATDKTGTLTCNELTVREILTADGASFQATGEGFKPEGKILSQGTPIAPNSHPLLQQLLRAGVLCNEGDLHQREAEWVWHGDPTDIALLSLGLKGGWNPQASWELHPQVHAIPFESERRYAASYHTMKDEGTFGFVKGAPEQVLAMCTGSDDEKQHWKAQSIALAENGYRIIALAERTYAQAPDPNALPLEPEELTFLGFVGMIDPLRSGVQEAIRNCASAGIRVCMVTGDHPATALAIARDLGLATNVKEVITGTDIEQMPVEELQHLLKTVRVFARVTPAQKLDIVKAAQAAGEFVAVTGDGVNDAPALRCANIGVAMGQRGTDVAREASELVLSDDNFSSIVAGVEEGRIAYDNVRKVIYLLISTGAAELALLTVSILAGLPLPLLPLQMLWLNLVTEGIQDVALAFEPGEGDALKKPPRRPREHIFNQLMIERVIAAALVMSTIAIGTFSWLLTHGWGEAEARNAILLLMVLFELIHIGNARSEKKSAFLLSPLRNPLLMLGTLIAFLLHLGSLYIPFMQSILQTQPVSLEVWGWLLLLAFSVLAVMEIHKLFWRMRYGTNHNGTV